MINLASDLDGTIYKGNQLINGVEETYKLLIKKKVNIIFTPHLIPINRGILSTIYIKGNIEDLEKILLRSKELEDSMSVSSGNNEEFVKISKEYSDLKPIVDNINAYNSNKKEYWNHNRNTNQKQEQEQE